ncbi:putative carbohydrate binding domain containing protein [uncultured Mediterranean phage uvMED]|nr:putative carbohydrate binding domain containing protein [uncultured Mediterranean phage uvMED]
MATLNLGAIRYNWKGAYNGSTAYVVNDVVSANGNSYICIQAGTGQAVGNATAYWNIMSSAGTNGTNGTDVGTTITTQGDILYRDGSGLQRLAKPASNKILQNTSGGVLSWVDDGGASIVSVQSATTGDYGNGATLDPLAITITPKSTSSKILFMASAHGEFSAGGWDTCIELRRAISGGATTDLIDSAGASGGQRYGFSAPYASYGQGDNDSTPDGFNIMVVDTPNTTSACEYKMVFQSTESFKLNRVIGSSHERFASTAVAIDFGG